MRGYNYRNYFFSEYPYVIISFSYNKLMSDSESMQIIAATHSFSFITCFSVLFVVYYKARLNRTVQYKSNNYDVVFKLKLCLRSAERVTILVFALIYLVLYTVELYKFAIQPNALVLCYYPVFHMLLTVVL